MTKTNKGPEDCRDAQIFSGLWWSVEVPQEWRAVREKECVTLRARPPRGAFQISAARKEQGPVTEQDLEEFAQEHIDRGGQMDKVSYGPFSGFSVQYAKEGLFWQEWWLRSGQLMVYATYNVVEGSEQAEKNDIERILSSLAER